MKFKTIEEITEFLTPFADSIGAEIVDVETKIKPPSLNIYLDTPNGIDLDTLEKFHNLINLPLDEFDVFEGNYTLNVSSPGLDRALKTERDFIRNMGRDMEIKFFAPMKGKKIIEAKLIGYNKNVITVEYQGEELNLELSKIAKINQAIKF